MRFGKEAAIAFLISLVWIQQIAGDEGRNASVTSKWTCSCLANQSSVVPENCSSSCDCTLADKSSKNRWICICAADGLPRVAAANSYSSCFTACDCHYGTQLEKQSPKKRISSKVILVILVLCATVIMLGFIVLMLCYVYRKDKYSIQRPLFSSDKETSYNSATNLILSQGTSIAEHGQYIGSSNCVTGCVPKASILFKRKSGVFYGTIIQFSYADLETATNKFSDSNLIGVGGSSHVYRGYLRTGRTVAIKRIKTQAGQDTDSAFLTEIELISRLHHCHVVPLLGYCSEHHGKHAERLLIFEFMANGNLRDCLDGASGRHLNWSTRVAVAFGAARGLEYLHEAAAPRILHRDVKSTNVLLDENYRAKITDLGMAKHLQNDGIPSGSSSPARMQGTFGYFAPEYAIVGRASLKSDVFSFGVVLLELITGRKPIHKSANKAEESLVIWATPRLLDSRRVVLELPDPNLKGEFEEEEMQVMAYLAKECLLLDPDSRPTMSEVVQILSTIAPETSKRKHFSRDEFKGSFSYDGKSTYGESPGFVEAEEIKQITSENRSAHYLLSPHCEFNHCGETSDQKEHVIPAAYVEKLLRQSSNSRSWSLQDDEAVDLTEPRFEKFHMPTVRSPGNNVGVVGK
uniref:Receptor-like serine/threonine-protein kinase NCRK isoform X1 n=1 Tax=Nicotiana tabacum TaxID=4097 RepID=A0A1S3XHB2_TOBAC|nr:PREDICTED: receptor-like serine/threonine-protein kinase NCRK isoform X1 [Nicotiana tabacum]XP_016439084.1 PREDICTED: receptor-like serine/threonine-protein kinase NCRK isoform X1 [Nicotiana tabacum]XP_016439085.1 PREDICTED: receptor-like serine/threonine-protein kinase NCRK isoform X1 [Nicotiana tabacum]XP_016439086.1 PREDICTED: receptor-like serine/threonine-protein kinase NCRK isoform X1 [Nicotiana tabacum]XP_016439087.1 PREDICTED: receptor-like serine/threonine-protein kinase NCRK isofor